MALAGAELEDRPPLSWAADPPCALPPSGHPQSTGQRAHPGQPHCPPCPALAAVGHGSPALARWGGCFPASRSPDPGKVPQPGTTQLPNVAICLWGLHSHLPGVRRGEGPGAQLQCGEGAEEAQPPQAGQAARVGWIWLRSVKQRHGGPAHSTPSGSLAPQPFALGKGLTTGSAAALCCQIKHRKITIPSPSSPFPPPCGHTGTSAALGPA